MIGFLLFALWAPFTGRPAYGEDAHELCVKAQKLIAQDDCKRAVKILKEVLEDDARNERAWSLLGRAYLKLERPSDALFAYRRVLRLNPDDTLARMRADRLTMRPFSASDTAVKEKGAGRSDRIAPPRRKRNTSPSSLERKAAKELEARAAGEKPPKRRWTLVIDPGHGGSDAGCAGILSGLYEKDAVLDIALELANAVRAARGDVDIFLTRMGDFNVSLEERAVSAALRRPDLFLSLQASCVAKKNMSGLRVYSFGPAASGSKGAEVAGNENAVLGRRRRDLAGRRFEYPGRLLAAETAAAVGEQSAALAKALFAALPKDMPLAAGGVDQGPFNLLSAAECPAVLVEAGFLSDEDDDKVLSDPARRADIAKGLAKAVLALIPSP